MDGRGRDVARMLRGGIIRPAGGRRAPSLGRTGLGAVMSALLLTLLATPGQASEATNAVRSAVPLGGYLPPHNPPKDVWPKPEYSFSPFSTIVTVVPPCWRETSGGFVAQPSAPKCVSDEVAATDNAHKGEHIGPIALPHDFAKLTAAEQLFVLADIERVSRGEPPVLGLSRTLDHFAQLGAEARADPTYPGGLPGATGGWAANWAGGVNALDSNYEWMYTDGWDGKHTFNYDCTSPKAPGCWGHRDNILLNSSRLPCYEASCSLVMGGGYVKRGAGNGYSSFSELFVQVSGTVPALYYTWADALKAGAKP